MWINIYRASLSQDSLLYYSMMIITARFTNGDFMYKNISRIANVHHLLSSSGLLMAETHAHPWTWGRWRVEWTPVKSLAFSLLAHFLLCRSCAVLQRFSILSNWRECVGGGRVLCWLLPLSRCQELLRCIELCKELRSSQTNAELWLCPWHIVTALIIYPCAFLTSYSASWLRRWLQKWRPWEDSQGSTTK